MDFSDRKLPNKSYIGIAFFFENSFSTSWIPRQTKSIMMVNLRGGENGKMHDPKEIKRIDLLKCGFIGDEMKMFIFHKTPLLYSLAQGIVVRLCSAKLLTSPKLCHLEYKI